MSRIRGTVPYVDAITARGERDAAEAATAPREELLAPGDG
jgi:hypothetical protein